MGRHAALELAKAGHAIFTALFSCNPSARYAPAAEASMVDISFPPPERLARFGQALDEIGRRARAGLGPDDVAHIERVERAARALGWGGRALLVLGPGPLSFLAGAAALAASKLLRAAEIGHTVLHGAYDRLDPSGRFHAEGFSWDFPVDEEAWRYGHNVRHHAYTGVVGRDADVSFGFVRLTEEAPHRLLTWLQVPALLLGGLPHFGALAHLQFTGVLDLFLGNGLPERFDFIADRSPRTIARTLARALRKPIRYYGKNYLLWPALAGPRFWKMMLGNAVAETLRDVYIGIVILSGHTDTQAFAPGTKAQSRPEWYFLQVIATRDFEAPAPLSLLCGGLDRQIEHHLFPDLPPNVLRRIAPEVRRACEEHGVPYRSESVPRTALSILRSLVALSRPDGSRASRRHPAPAQASGSPS
jgi:NADPH-dependent stearoyl-CoA 9-desaturase